MKRFVGRLGIGSVFALIGVAALAGGAFSLATRDNSSATAKDNANNNNNSNPGPSGVPPWVRGQRNFHRPTAKEMRQHMKQRRARLKQFESELADQLGVSQEKVHNAFKNIMKKRLDQAVDNGNLTRSQADKILGCFDGGSNCQPPFGRGGPPGGGPPMGGPPGGPPMGGPGGYGPPM
ncbi:MAG TPA: hypothetical protein VGF21_13130 [Thermoleophilaceae bacterium]|jgi:uncharacterized protein HemX